MIQWHLLNHAYGEASDLPALLADLRPDPQSDVWAALRSLVCHQGTIYSASYPVLSILLEKTRHWPPAGRAMALDLAGAIVISDDRVDVGDTAAYEPIVEALRQLAHQTLAEAQGLSAKEMIYLLQATLALQGDRFWSEQLDQLAAGEFEGLCPGCGTWLYLVIGEYGFFTTTGDWVRGSTAPRLPLQPAERSALEGTGRWLHDHAAAASQPVLADWIRHVFGSTTCPDCGAAVDVVSAIIRAGTPGPEAHDPPSR